MSEKQDYIHKIFMLAKLRGLCRTQKEFAGLLGVDPAGVSMAMNGSDRYLTDSFVGKVRALAISEGLEEGTAPMPRPGGIYLPPETLDLFNNLSETIRLQAEMLSQRSRTAQPVPSQKNEFRDGWK